jgi:hypothetical protein
MTIKTENRQPMGMTTQHPRRLPRPQRIIWAPYSKLFRSWAYPPSANKPRFRRMVKVTLKMTLTTIQNRHPGPTRRKENRLPLA